MSLAQLERESWPSAWPESRPFRDADWLRPTGQLDITHPKVHITAQKLTQARQTRAARAAALQDYVRRMPFAASADGGTVRASEVLARARGDCHSKGVLFTALCRAAGLPARLVFVQVRTGFLHGILDERPEAMPHAVAQVRVDGRWWSTDGYVVDPVLFARAKEQLRETGEDCGWGLVRNASGAWDGQSDCLHQFRPEDVLEQFGAFHDAAEFHACGPHAHGWIAFLKYALGARLVNRRVQRLRQGDPEAPPARRA